MSDTTNISWCDATWNPWRGCSKVSPGCKNCYAETLVNRFGGDFSKRTKAAPDTFNAPLRWNKKPWVCESCHYELGGIPAWCPRCEDMERGEHPVRHRRVFLGSLMDWLDPEVPIEWLADVLDIVRRCPGLDFLMLTKRPELWEARMRKVAFEISDAYTFWMQDWLDGHPPKNVWLGTSVEDQRRADERMPALLTIPAKVRFLSVEPLLKPVDLSSGTYASNGMGVVWDAFGRVAHTPHCDYTAKGLTPPAGPGVSWVIVGGESGHNRRDCGVDAIINVHDQCRAAGVPCFVKQDCAAKPGQQGRIPENVWKCKEFPK